MALQADDPRRPRQRRSAGSDATAGAAIGYAIEPGLNHLTVVTAAATQRATLDWLRWTVDRTIPSEQGVADARLHWMVRGFVVAVAYLTLGQFSTAACVALRLPPFRLWRAAVAALPALPHFLGLQAVLAGDEARGCWRGLLLEGGLVALVAGGYLAAIALWLDQRGLVPVANPVLPLAMGTFVALNAWGRTWRARCSSRRCWRRWWWGGSWARSARSWGETDPTLQNANSCHGTTGRTRLCYDMS